MKIHNYLNLNYDLPKIIFFIRLITVFNWSFSFYTFTVCALAFKYMHGRFLSEQSLPRPHLLFCVSNVHVTIIECCQALGVGLSSWHNVFILNLPASTNVGRWYIWNFFNSTVSLLSWRCYAVSSSVPFKRGYDLSF
jgi:hypothetical protein